MKDKQLKYKWLYETYENDLFSYGMAFGLEKEALEDAIHDVFLHLYEREHGLWESENIKFYLLNCLKNHILSLQRKKIRLENIEETEEYRFMIDVEGLESIEAEEERIEITRQLEKLLQCLTDRQREAIYLRFAQNMSFEKVAEMLDINTKGAQKLVYRAIEQMRKHTFFLFFMGYF